MMRVLVDSDVVIAAMLDNEAQTPECKVVMQALLDRKFVGVTTPVLMANIQHILGRKWEVKKGAPDRPKVIRAMTILLPLFTMAPVDTADFYASMASGFVDLEDGMQHFAALRSGKVDAIVTCNGKDFPKAATQLEVYSPADFVTDIL
ncbi:MAG: PIN domain-containing protein [Flavobacteriales bacterium]|nr:PIN domain-containing protein [Flavobacteriales bacterium]